MKYEKELQDMIDDGYELRIYRDGAGAAVEVSGTKKAKHGIVGASYDLGGFSKKALQTIAKAAAKLGSKEM